MCLCAIFWARPNKVFYASTRFDAASAGFDDAVFYDEMLIPPAERTIPMMYVPHKNAIKIFQKWIVDPHKTLY